MNREAPQVIEVRGARVNNLRDIDVDVPLGTLVAVAGVSGSGKSSLAMGVLYAEGSRRYIEALSTYTRRRMSQAPRADVERVTHVPAALALKQRPGIPGPRSTFGTSTELLNVIRLMFSRLGAHECPNGHRHPPTYRVAAEQTLTCPECSVEFDAPGAEELAFNSGGACPTCDGLGTTREVDDASLIRDESMSIDEGAVLPWQTFGFNVQPDIVREFGVRTDVPFRELSDWERDIVFDGPEEKKHINVRTKKGVHDLDFTFRNARLTVTEELKRATDGKRLDKVSRFLTERTCRTCEGTRLAPHARAPRIGELGLAEVTAMTLADVDEWVDDACGMLPTDLQAMGERLAEAFHGVSRRLLELGLGYLTLDRAGATLSTGELQRVQLARSVRNETTGVLYVLDEPSIGLHPSNIEGLIGVFDDLLAGGNSVVLVDHDPLVLRRAEHLIEIGPGSGRDGGSVIAAGAVDKLGPDSRIAGFLSGGEESRVRGEVPAGEIFAHGTLEMRTSPVHTVHALDVSLPVGRLTVVTGVSGSGKTTLVLDSLVPALAGKTPPHVTSLIDDSTVPITTVHMVDATPIGHNVRSTVATYSGVLDDLRRAYARLDSAKSAGLTASDFSYNTGSLKCPQCQGTGEITLDVQFLPDVTIACPTCEGSRYAPGASEHRRQGHSLPEVLAMTVAEAYDEVTGLRKVSDRLEKLIDVGLGYLTLGEATPALSGGEAQRLKLVSELGKSQAGALFVFDEPTVGLHPLDVRVLIGVLERLVQQGGTVVVIEHDLDMIANADYIVDLGPGGGVDGGRIVATGTPWQVAAGEGITARYLAGHLG